MKVKELIEALQMSVNKEAPVFVYCNDQPKEIYYVDDTFADNHRVDINIIEEPSEEVGRHNAKMYHEGRITGIDEAMVIIKNYLKNEKQKQVWLEEMWEKEHKGVDKKTIFGMEFEVKKVNL